MANADFERRFLRQLIRLRIQRLAVLARVLLKASVTSGLGNMSHRVHIVQDSLGRFERMRSFRPAVKQETDCFGTCTDGAGTEHRSQPPVLTPEGIRRATEQNAG